MLLYTISYLNWKYIELPFQKNFIRSKKMALSILFVVMCGSTLTLLNEDSFINRYTNIPNKALLLAFKNQDSISQNGVDCDNRSIKNTCIFKASNSNKNVYVIGDSSFRTLSTDCWNTKMTVLILFIWEEMIACFYLEKSSVRTHVQIKISMK